jgi:exopolysaccharide production protein ExoQ
MSQVTATVCCIGGIVSLYLLDREKNGQVSKGLWIPVIYLLLAGSRSVSAWLGNAPRDAANGVYSSPVDAAVSLGLLALAAMVLSTRGRKVWELLRGNGPTLLFYSYAALSILWSDFPGVTFKHWTKAVVDVMMVLIVLTDSDPVMAVKRLLTRAGFVLIPLSLLLCKYYPALGRRPTRSNFIQYVGVTDQKNQLGMICLIFGLGSLWYFLKAYRDGKRLTRTRQLVAHGAMLGIVAWLLQMSNSMTALACFVLAGAVMALASRRSPAKPVRVHLLAAAAVCSAFFALFVARSLVEVLGRDQTLTGRTEIWHVLPGLVRNPWVGAGYETFLVGPRLMELRLIFEDTFQEAHNGYLEVYLNLGWVGVSLFALLVITGYQKVVAAFRREPAVGSLRLAFFVAIVIYAMTEAPFRMLSPTWFFLLWAIIGAQDAVRLHPRCRSEASLRHVRSQPALSAVQELECTNGSESRISV